jgi:hypothetical protein
MNERAIKQNVIPSEAEESNLKFIRSFDSFRGRIRSG